MTADVTAADQGRAMEAAMGEGGQTKGQALVAARVAAYEAAVRLGRARYGGRAPGATAVDFAAWQLGLKSPAPIVAALRAAAHPDLVGAETARAVRKRHRVRRKARAPQAAEPGVARPVSDTASPRAKTRKPAAPLPRKKRRALDRALDKAKQRQRDALVGRRMVDDPYEVGAKLEVRVNVAEHPAELLRARKVIDDTQYEAASRFRAAYEQAGVGGVRGIDPTREAVDGGKGASAEINAAAFDRLRRYARRMTREGYLVVAAVMGQGTSIAEVAARFGAAQASPVAAATLHGYIRQVLTDGLDAIATADGGRGPKPTLVRFAAALGVYVPDEAPLRVNGESVPLDRIDAHVRNHVAASKAS